VKQENGHGKKDEQVPVSESGQQRISDFTVDKNLRFTTTVTFVVTMILITVIERLMFRQDLYIDRDRVTHDMMDEAMDEMHHDDVMLREYLAVKFGEMLP